MLFSALRMEAHGGSSPDRYGTLFPLTLTALGVVYGDIGTSPLYAIRECFFGSHSVPPTHDNVLGVLSLVLYALLLVISIKYTTLVMRADNQGEGGILSLTALLPTRNGNRSGHGISILVGLGIIGASLLLGEGMITPAVSILGAIEGLQVATPVFSPWVVPITVVILVVLFVIQRHGTHRVGGLFGPGMVVWFVTLAAMGFRWIAQAPEVLSAFDPRWAVNFFLEHGWHGFAVL
ncbi:MAG TPA: KUP/HAK/KT family potassium transporter, partial [Vicinamibacterales bacterium]|nr:KUP/HAK/KT family potassium transporter [Vicinamibacterales bacterium]